jgi:hypothetical protein
MLHAVPPIKGPRSDGSGNDIGLISQLVYSQIPAGVE